MNKKLRYKIITFFVSILFFLPNLSLAAKSCSRDGYTVLTVNGIFTDESGAKDNSENLKKKLPQLYNN